MTRSGTPSSLRAPGAASAAASTARARRRAGVSRMQKSLTSAFRTRNRALGGHPALRVAAASALTWAAPGRPRGCSRPARWVARRAAGTRAGDEGRAARAPGYTRGLAECRATRARGSSERHAARRHPLRPPARRSARCRAPAREPSRPSASEHLLAKIASVLLPPASGRRNASERNICFSPLLRLGCPLEEAPGMLTKRQKELLDFLRAYIAEHGYAPTLDEIGRHFALGSLATVHKHLTNLERKGRIRRLANHSRALELTEVPAAGAAVAVPLLGRVAAGAPIEAVEVPETVTLPEELLGRGETFALRVRGDSMIGEGILDGDLIVVESRPDAENGATVVALVRGEATVKKLYHERGRVRLVPANEKLAPIVARPADVEIRGVVIAVLRRYR